jgi:hypothetical protein
MSADISGWVEIQDQNDHWQGIVQIDHLVQRSHGMFSHLFGDKDDDDPDVIVGRRGIPVPHSVEVGRRLHSGPDPIHPS